MAKVTNTDKRSPRSIAGVVIPPGATREVPDSELERVHGKPVVAGWLRSGILTIDGEVGASDEDLEAAEKERLIEELGKLGVTKTKRSSLESLQKALEEAQAAERKK